MSSIDKRVVEMDFDNRKFERGVSTTLKSLTRLKDNLDMSRSAKSLQKLENQGTRSFDSLEHGLDRLNRKFSTFGVAWMSVVNKVTGKVLDKFTNTINQIRTGGQRRAANIEQAGFMLDGLFGKKSIQVMENGKKKTVKIVDEIKKNAMDAVDGTAYGFDEAAKAASQFAASGVQAGDEMMHTLRGVAGVAAMTSSSFDDIADVFTTAAGKGKVQADEFNRLAARGLNARAILAKQLDITEDDVLDLAKKGQISFQMFADAMYDAFGKQAAKANKTFDGALSNVKASLNRIGELWYTPHREHMRTTFVEEIGMFNALKKVLAPIINIFSRLDYFYNRLKVDKIHKITGMLENLGTAADTFLNDKGTRAISRSIRNILNLYKPVFKALTDGFEDVFGLGKKFKKFLPFESLEETFKRLKKQDKFAPAYLDEKKLKAANKAYNDVISADLGKNLVKAARDFRKFTATIKFSDQTLANLKDTFSGIFAVAHIFFNLIKSIFEAFKPSSAKGIGNFIDLILAITGAIGRALVNLDKFISKVGLFKAVFTPVAVVVKLFLGLLSSVFGVLAKGITSLKDISSLKIEKFIDSLKSFSEVGESIKNFFSTRIITRFQDFVNGFKELFKTGVGDLNIGKGAKSAFDKIKELLTLDTSKFSMSVVGDETKRFGDKLGDTTSKLKEFIDNLGAKDKVKTAGSNFTKAIGKVREEGLGNFVKSLDIKGKAQTAGGKVADFFKGVFTAIKGFDYAALGDTIVKGFKSFIDILEKLRDAVKEFYKAHLAERLKELGDNIGEFLKQIPEKAVDTSAKVLGKFSDALGGIGGHLKGAADSISNGFKSLSDIGKKYGGVVSIIEQIIGGAIAAVLLFKQWQAIKSIREDTRPVIDTIKSFKGVLDSLSGALDEGFKIQKVESKYDQIVKISAAILLLSGALKVLSTVNPDQVIPSLITMLGLLVGLMVAAKLLQLAFAKVDPSLLQGIGTFIILLSAAVSLLSFALSDLANNVDADNIVYAVIALAAVTAALGGLLFVIKKLFELKKTDAFDVKAFFQIGLALVALGKAIDWMANAVATLGAIDEKQLINGVIAVFAIVTAMSIFTAMTGQGEHILTSAAAMFILAGAVSKLGEVVKMFAESFTQNDFEKGMKMVAAVAGIFAVFVLLGAFAKYALESAALIIAAVAALEVIRQEISLFCQMITKDEATFGKALTIVGVIMVLLTLMMLLAGGVGNDAMKGAAGIALMATAVLEFASALAVLMYTVYDLPSFIGGVIGLAIAIGLLYAATKLFESTGGIKNGGVLAVLGLGLLAIATAIAVVASLPIATLAVALVALAGGIAALCLVLSAFGTTSVLMIAAAAALVLLGIAVMSVGLGIKLLAAGLKELIPLIILFATLPDDILAGGLATIQVVLESIGEGLTMLSIGILLVAAGFLAGAAATVIFGVGLLLVGAGILAVSAGILALTGAIYVFSTVTQQSIGDVAGTVMNVFGGIFSFVTQGLGSIGSKFGETASNVKAKMGEIKNSIFGAKKDTADAAKQTAQETTDTTAKEIADSKGKVTEATKTALDPKEAFDAIKGKFSDGGTSVIGGFSDSLMEGAGSIDLSSMLGKTVDLEALKGQGFDMGAVMPEGIQEGINSGDINLDGLLGKVGKQLGNTKEATKQGGNQAKAYGGAMSKSTAPSKEAKSMANKAAKSADDKTDFVTSGKNAALGYAEGIRSYAEQAAEEAAAMVRKAKAAAKNAQKESSPAKVFIESGMYAALGYAVGIKKFAFKAADEAKAMVGTTINTLDRSIAKVASIASADFNIDPTIRPVVDMTNVDAAAESIDKTFATPFGLSVPSTGIRLAETIAADIQNGGNLNVASQLGRLTKRLDSVTQAMNSRQMNNYFQIDGSSDPEGFADAVAGRLELNARTL